MEKDLKWLYGTLLSAPGMDELVKLDFKASRKVVLLLDEVIARGLEVKGNGLPESIDKSVLEELKMISYGFVEKAGMTEMTEKLKQLS